MNDRKQVGIYIGGMHGHEGDANDKYDIIWNIDYTVENENDSLEERLLTGNLSSVNPALDEAVKLAFLGEAFDKVKDIFLRQRYIPRIGKNLPLFWLTGLSQKKPSKTKIVSAYEYAQSVKRLLHLNRSILLGANIKIHSTDPELEKVLNLLLASKSEDYEYEFSKSKRSIRQVAISLVKPVVRLALSILRYFSLIIYYKKNITSKQCGVANKNKRILALVDNNWELHLTEGYVNSMYWPELSKMADSHGYTMVWLPLLRIQNADVRQHIEHLLTSEFQSVNFTFKECISHLKQLILNVVFLLKNRLLAGPIVLDDVDLTSIVNFEAQNLVLGSSLEMSLYYSLIKNSAKDADIIIERKPFNALGRVLLYACNDTPVIGMQHGVVNDSQLGYVFTKNELDITQRTGRFDRCQVPNVMGVFGQRMVDRMITNNYPSDWLAVIGDMKFNVAKYQENLPLRFEVDKCMFVLQYDKTFIDNWLPVVAKSLFAQRGHFAHIVIKPHPQNTDLGSYAKDLLLSLDFSEDAISVSTEPFITAVDEVDIVVSHSSTAIIESLYRGKPVLLIIDNSCENDNSLFRSAACCFSFSNDVGFSRILMKIMNLPVNDWNDSRQKFLTYNLENIRSDPYERFFEQCGSMVS